MNQENSGREGQCRVRLMKSHKSRDCAYPGVEPLPGGTFVCTTHGHWTKDEPPHVMSARFRLEEVGAKGQADVGNGGKAPL